MVACEKELIRTLDETARSQAKILFNKFCKQPISNQLILRTQWRLWDEVAEHFHHGYSAVAMDVIFHYGFQEGQRAERTRKARRNRRTGGVRHE